MPFSTVSQLNLKCYRYITETSAECLGHNLCLFEYQPVLFLTNHPFIFNMYIIYIHCSFRNQLFKRLLLLLKFTPASENGLQPSELARNSSARMLGGVA